MREAPSPGSVVVADAMPLRIVPALLVLALAGALAIAVLALPEPYPGLVDHAHAELAASGVGNPVTAVLLNFRAYDTLLEVGVLVLALLGVFSLEPAVWRTVSRTPHPRDALIYGALIRLLIPTMLLASGYLLWAGTKMAGGAFQAAAVLAGGGVLLLLGGIASPAALNTRLVRLLAVAGLAFFVAIGLGLMLVGRPFLDYPLAWSYPLIFAIEAALTVSIGAILALLYAGSVQAPPSAPPEIH